MTAATELADREADPRTGQEADRSEEPGGRDRRRDPAARRAVLLGAVLTVALAFAIAASVSLGTVRIPLGDVWAIVAHRITPDTWWTGTWSPWWTEARGAIVIDSRLPRALTAALVGAALAVAGAVAQAVTRNPLADPYLLGVSSGAGFGIVLVTVLGVGSGLAGALTLPLAAFFGALIPLLGTVLVAARARDVTAIILVGVAMSMVLSAAITYLLLVVGDDHQMGTVMRWLAGGFGDARWSLLWAPAVVIIVLTAMVIATGRWLNLLHAGDDGAAAMGMNVRRFRLLILLAVSVLTAAAVAVSGTIGFVGLLIPHLAGYLVGRNAIRLIPIAALLGAVALVAADVLARTVSSDTELPVGVVTALIGGPIFVVMLWRRYKVVS